MPKKKGDKSMKLVLAEKPSVAQSIAKVLGANKRCDGYLEGNGYNVSWCQGCQINKFSLFSGENARGDKIALIRLSW